jgi:hypothetical protein
MSLPTQKLARHFVLVCSLLMLSWVYSYIDILPLRPTSVHQWRQADGLSIADNYYEGNWNFFQPSLHLLFSDGETSGKSAGEFPLIYYLVAILWKIFGKHEIIFRLVTIVFSFCGLLALFKLSYAILKDYFWALASVIFLFSSPIFAFYTNNFLVNIPAFSLMLIALWRFYLFWKSGRDRNLYLSMTLFLFVGLFKPSSLLAFLVIGVLYLLEVLGHVKLKAEGRVFAKPLKQAIPFAAVLAGVAAWYSYVISYNNMHGGVYTINNVQTYWSTSPEQINSSLNAFRNFIVFQVLSIPSYLYLLLCLVYLTVRFRKVALVWRIAIPLLVVGYLGFILLFFYSLDYHDYYHIDFLIVPVVINLAFLHYLRRNEFRIFQSHLLKLAFGFFLFYNVLYCANNMHLRYWGQNNHQSYFRQLLSPKVDLDGWAYAAWVYPFAPYETVTPVLRAHGIKREDRVICPEDCSYSISLYLMDQKGWTNVGSTLTDSACIADRIIHGAQYLMLTDTANFRLPFLHPYGGHHLFSYEKLQIFDLRPYAEIIRKKKEGK